MFPVRRVERASAEAMEPLGTKPKYWFRDGFRRLLFKADERGTGEDWAEMVASHLCHLLGVPHVSYELAEEFDGNQRIQPGVVCETMAPPPLSLILGNQLLLERDPGYPTQRRFKVRQHTIAAVSEVLAGLQPPPIQWTGATPQGIQSALDFFIGYVLLDAWIANQDRHHENWAALRDDVMRLAPTFDHGAALARNLTDDERQDRLRTRDRNRTVLAFAERGRSAFNNDAESTKSLGLVEACSRFCELAPAAAQVWIGQLAAVGDEAITQILDQVPPERMSKTTKEFTLALLKVNQQRLLQELNQ